MRLLPLLLLAAAPTLAPAAAAALPQAPEDPGPHLVGWRDVVFQDAIFGQGTIRGRVYYPALSAGQDAPPDPGSGPHLLTGFQHGWLGRPSDYDLLSAHIASWGFVVSSIGTETGLFPDTAQYARDSRSMLHWVEAESANPASWLSGMVLAGAEWSVTGHSMGGGTLSLIVGIEPRIQTIIGLQAASTNATGNANMSAFGGRAYWIAGSEDWIVRSGTVYAWFDRATSSERNLFWEIQGMGHVGPTDTPATNEPLSGPEQHRLHRRLVAGILRAEHSGDEDLYHALCGQGWATEPSRQRSRSAQPPLWVHLPAGGTELEIGLAGVQDQPGVLAWSLVPGSTSTAYGTLGLSRPDLEIHFQGSLGGDGLQLSTLPVSPAWSGLPLHLQGLALHPGGTGAFTRTATIQIP